MCVQCHSLSLSPSSRPVALRLISRRVAIATSGNATPAQPECPRTPNALLGSAVPLSSTHATCAGLTQCEPSRSPPDARGLNRQQTRNSRPYHKQRSPMLGCWLWMSPPQVQRRPRLRQPSPIDSFRGGLEVVKQGPTKSAQRHDSFPHSLVLSSMEDRYTDTQILRWCKAKNPLLPRHGRAVHFEHCSWCKEKERSSSMCPNWDRKPHLGSRCLGKIRNLIARYCQSDTGGHLSLPCRQCHGMGLNDCREVARIEPRYRSRERT